MLHFGIVRFVHEKTNALRLILVENAHMLRANETIAKIYLRYNMIYECGMLAIASALEQNPYVTAITKYNPIGYEFTTPAVKRNRRIAERAKTACKEATLLLLCVNWSKQVRTTGSIGKIENAARRVPRMVWIHKILVHLFDAEGFHAEIVGGRITYNR